MQNPQQVPDNAQVDRFADRLLNALANLDRYANGYDKKDDYAVPAAAETQAPTRAG